MRELGHGLQEHDAMRCRSCGNEERASEGMPCESCSTFICLMCQLKGVRHCAACDGRPLPTGGNASGTSPNAVKTNHETAVASSANSIASTTAASVTTPQPPAKTADVAGAKTEFDDEDQLIDYLFDQLSPPDDRPTP
jgi:hypothetical protein